MMISFVLKTQEEKKTEYEEEQRTNIEKKKQPSA